MSGPADAACYALRALADRYHLLDKKRACTTVSWPPLPTELPRLSPACLASVTTPPPNCSSSWVTTTPTESAAKRVWPSLRHVPHPCVLRKTSRHRLNRSPTGQPRILVCACDLRTHDRLRRSTHRRRESHERDPALLERLSAGARQLGDVTRFESRFERPQPGPRAGGGVVSPARASGRRCP